VNKSNIVIASVCVLTFSLGAYFWKVNNTGRIVLSAETDDKETAVATTAFTGDGVILYVEDAPITANDVEWEYDLLTSGIIDNQELTYIPDLGDKMNEYLQPLKEQLASSLIERKVLFNFIKSDRSFSISNPERYHDCLQQWQETTKKSPETFGSKKDRERLKNRLCEQSLLNQYLEEKIVPPLKVSDEEIAAYYKANPREFNRPERAVVRQIVLNTEEDAKAVKSKLKRDNFAEMASQHSIAPEAKDGGLLKPFALGEMPTFFDVAFSMREGEIRGILKSKYGYHLILLEERLAKETIKLKAAHPVIMRKLLEKKKEEAYKKWVEAALNAVSVKTTKSSW
jgi:peptidyl-prolyl cis-trans isomerase C